MSPVTVSVSAGLAILAAEMAFLRWLWRKIESSRLDALNREYAELLSRESAS